MVRDSLRTVVVLAAAALSLAAPVPVALGRAAETTDDIAPENSLGAARTTAIVAAASDRATATPPEKLFGAPEYMDGSFERLSNHPADLVGGKTNAVVGSAVVGALVGGPIGAGAAGIFSNTVLNEDEDLKPEARRLDEQSPDAAVGQHARIVEEEAAPTALSANTSRHAAATPPEKLFGAPEYMDGSPERLINHPADLVGGKTNAVVGAAVVGALVGGPIGAGAAGIFTNTVLNEDEPTPEERG